jgi:hypothetical protein
MLGYNNLAMVMREYLNSVEPKFIRREARRCYVFSDGDEFILERDVEDHAQEAESKGLSVEKVKFAGTSHVGHMRSDPGRYWEIVEQTWEARA